MADILHHSTLTTGLVAYWPLDEESDGTGAVTRVDAHSTWDLTDNGTCPSRTGHVGSFAASFTPVNTEYLHGSTSFGAAVGSSVTTFSGSFWFKKDIAGDNDGLFYIGTFTGTQGEFDSHLATGNRHYAVWNGGAQNDGGFAQSDTSSFHHYVWVYDGTNFKVYLDGTLKTTTAYTTALDFTGGKPVVGGYYSSGFLFDGAIEQLGVWNKALSTSEIADLYNSGSGIPYDDGSGGGSTFVPRIMMVV